MPTTQRGAILLPAAVATAAALVVGFGGAAFYKRHDTKGRPTPAPQFAVFNAASRASVLSYARTLSFASFHGMSDTRRLSPSCRSCPPGPIATVEPESGLHLITDGDLGRGRIIARIINLDTVAMPGIAAHDTAYVWVDSMQGYWRAMQVPSRIDEPVIENDLDYVRHPGVRWNQPLARWVWTPEVGVTSTEPTWVSCATGCCTKQMRPRKPQ